METQQSPKKYTLEEKAPDPIRACLTAYDELKTHPVDAQLDECRALLASDEPLDLHLVLETKSKNLFLKDWERELKMLAELGEKKSWHTKETFASANMAIGITGRRQILPIAMDDERLGTDLFEAKEKLRKVIEEPWCQAIPLSRRNQLVNAYKAICAVYDYNFKA